MACLIMEKSANYSDKKKKIATYKSNQHGELWTGVEIRNLLNLLKFEPAFQKAKT